MAKMTGRMAGQNGSVGQIIALGSEIFWNCSTFFAVLSRYLVEFY